MSKEVELDIVYEKKGDGFERSQKLLVSRYSEFPELIYVEFGEYETILHINDLIEQFKGFLD